MPAFGERRMAAGLPISMIPAQKYREASDRITEVYRESDPAKAYASACERGVEYLFLGPAERALYPQA